MKSTMLFIALLCALQGASAGVVIQQVLYDPNGTESGGEAVELKNVGSVPIDISGWVLSTDNSASDARIPEGVVLLPNEGFLVADEGWDDLKDDPDWRPANHLEKITLGNSKGFVALRDGDVQVDAVG